MKRNQLSVAFVRKAPPGRHMDGGGLMLVVKPTGGRSWILRVTIRGDRRDIGLGSAEFVTLAQARRLAFDYRAIARAGGDPTIRADLREVPTFADAADLVIAMHAATWKDGGKSERQWRASLRTYAFPRLGRKPVDQITTADVLAVLVPIWATKRETARRVRQRISAVMLWTVAEGHREANPAGEAIGAALPKNGNLREHQKALPYVEVGAALATVRGSRAGLATTLAFEFLTLTACRSGEVRGARWSEVDIEGATWTVPADRMKAKRAHRVPLSARAVEVLEAARGIADGSGLVFPSVTGRVLSDSTLSKLVRELGIGCVPHGMRSSFRQWAAERTNIPREVAEGALAHSNPDRVEAAYQRSDLFERRRDLMEAWARYVEAKPATVARIA